MNIIPSYNEFRIDESRFIASMISAKLRVDPSRYSYTEIKYWDSLDALLQKKRKKGKWRKFSYTELVWLRIIKILRYYGLDIDKILLIKNSIFNSFKEDFKFQFGMWKALKFGYQLHLYVLPNGESYIDYDSGFFTRQEAYLTINLNEIIKQEVKI